MTDDDMKAWRDANEIVTAARALRDARSSPTDGSIHNELEALVKALKNYEASRRTPPSESSLARAKRYLNDRFGYGAWVDADNDVQDLAAEFDAVKAEVGEWRPIADLPSELQELPSPKLGQHVCYVETARDGTMWVIQFHNTNGTALRCYRLPAPPRAEEKGE